LIRHCERSEAIQTAFEAWIASALRPRDDGDEAIQRAR
jgi:hypothetical protein